MDSKIRLIVALRWILWVFGTLSFGICITYFLIDTTFYYWISSVSRAQVGLAGAIHVYHYLSAVWMSVKPQGFIAWAGLDVVFAMLAIAAAATSQPRIQEYCVPGSTTLLWSDRKFAFVRAAQREPGDESTDTAVLSRSYNQMACGFSAAVIVCNAILVGLFIATAYFQLKRHRHDSMGYDRHFSDSDSEKPFHKSDERRGWRTTLIAPFKKRQPMDLQT